MKTFLGVVLVMIGITASAAFAQTVKTVTGKVKGSTENGISTFLGIPYAAPPVGENRWREPQPAAAWRGVRDATEYGSDCAQAPFPPGILTGIQTETAEDCLFVNVWKPADANKGDDLPVIVWVHGGGFVYGGSSQSVYSGEKFANNGVVYVSLNYRLGRYGFFAHPALDDAGFGANFGYLDQIAALEWVRDNIEAFGGDPERVTVFGESAGGMSMHMLLQSPLARGLFSGIIIQSGGGRDRAMPMLNIAQAAAGGLEFSTATTAEELRAIPSEKVTGELSMASMNRPGYPGPFVDGRTILADPLTAVQSGLYVDVPVIVGANSADGFPRGEDKDEVFAFFGEDAGAARALYDPDGNTGGLEVATKVSADTMFIEPARAIARAMAAQGQDVWLYRFAHVGVETGIGMGGAPHASEIPHVFGHPDVRLRKLENDRDDAVAELIHGYWVNFAKTGSPDGDGDLPAWPKATADTTSVQLIGSEGATHTEDPRTAILDFRESLLEK